ncbi:MAG: helix-turn-helix domain-containing protein [Paludibacter sp.]|nr:helix-turn-helix domain-containing protein [Paludibacter sp.]
MNIDEILRSGTNVSITISANDLLEVINYTVTVTRREMEQLVNDDKMEAYLTADEVSEMIGVTKVTLWRWSKRGYLMPTEVGGKRRYCKSEITAKFLNQNSAK